MYFANTWGLLGLVALPVIVVIHLYHRRYPTLPIAGLHLWGVETHTTTAGRTRERLPLTASLICELLAAFLLSLVLADPRWGQLGKVAHLVVVLDNSASMSARPPGEKPFRESAIDELERRISQLPRGSVVTLLRTGRRPEMLAGPATSWDEAKQKLVDWRPSLPKHDFLPTWDLAAQLAEGNGKLLFLTDAVPGEDVAVPKTMEVASVGRTLENVSISAARWDFDSLAAKGRVFVRLTNHGRRKANVRIAGMLGSVDGLNEAAAREARVPAGNTATTTDAPLRKKIFENDVTLDVGASVPLEVDVPGGLGRMTLECESIGDGLALDNRVELIEPKVRLLHVAVTLPKDNATEQAVNRVLTTLPNISVTESETAELIIAPSDPLPPSQRELWWLGIGPLDTSDEARKAALDLAGPYVLEKQNPLLDGLTLGGVVWGGAQPVKLEVSPIITSGTLPLLARLTGTRTTAYLLNIDFARTNLGDSPDWPILMSNLVELRRDNLPGLRRSNYRMNEEIRFRIADTAAAAVTSSTQQNGSANGATQNEQEADSPRTLLLVHRGLKRPLARASTIEIPLLDESGVYSVLDGENLVGEFAVAFFDSEESSLSNLRPGRREPEMSTSESGFLLDQPLTWIVLIGIVLIAAAAFADWSVLRSSAGRRG